MANATDSPSLLLTASSCFGPPHATTGAIASCVLSNRQYPVLHMLEGIHSRHQM